MKIIIFLFMSFSIFAESIFGNFAIGENVVVKNEISNHYMVAGTNITIDKKIQNIVVAGRNVTINKDLHNAKIYADTVIINGKIDGKVKVYARNLYLNNDMNGYLDASVSMLKINTIVTGQIESSGEVILTDTAIVTGQILQKVTEKEKPVKKLNYRHHGIRLLYKTLTLFFFSLIILLVDKNIKQIDVEKNIIKTIFIGFAGVFLIPVALIIVMFTFVGIPISIVALLLYIALLCLAIPVTNLLLCNKAFNKIKFFQLLLMSIVVMLAISVPYAGIFAKLLLVFIGTGVTIERVIS